LAKIVFGNIGVKRKTSIVNNVMVEVTKNGNKILITSINKIQKTNLEIENWWIEYYKLRYVKANNTQKGMV
jgi:hypothetical protein